MSTLTSVTVFKKAEHNFGYKLVTNWLQTGYTCTEISFCLTTIERM